MWKLGLCILLLWQGIWADSQDVVRSFHQLDGLIQETVWCGQANKVILIRTEYNSVYRSIDHGETFKIITKKMLKTAERLVENSEKIGEVTRIVRSEADPEILVFIGNKGVHWITTNCGKSMRALSKDFIIGQIRMHPTLSNLMLATAIEDCKDDDDTICYFGTHSLYFTEDLGATWRQIAINVKQFEWPFNSNQIAVVPETRIYALLRTTSQDILVKSDDYFATRTVLVNNCLEFKLRGSFMFAITTVKRDQVYLLVSTLSDSFDKFYKAVFPDIKLKMKNVHVLDASEGVVFVLTTRKPTDPFGRLYISDSTGLRFRLALKTCLRSSVRGADLAKIQGLEGIYLVSIVNKDAAKEYERAMEKDDLEEEEWSEEERKAGNYFWAPRTKKAKSLKRLISNNIRTVITFNKGGSWQYLKPPKVALNGKDINCRGDSACSLNLFLHMDTAVPIYSQKYAYGLILASGNYGKARKNKDENKKLYMSRDGGLRWTEIGKGMHVFDIADHGALVIMSKLYAAGKKNATLMYSWNEGKTWENINITHPNSLIDDVFSEPRSISQNFLLHLIQYNYTEDEISVFSTIARLDFSKLKQRQCEGDDPKDPKSDFEYWSPYGGKDGQECVLGRKIWYTRKKRDRECYVGSEFLFLPDTEDCECTEADYECDFGFYRGDAGSESGCLPSIHINYTAPSNCPLGGNYTVSSGYRKIVGDTCKGGITHDPMVLPCPSLISKMSSSPLKMMLGLGVVVLILYILWHIFKNFGDIKDKLRELLNKAKSTENKGKSMKPMSATIRRNEEDDDEDLIIQPSGIETEGKVEKKSQ
eukprot:TRINITY_DN16449_c0_g3_i1.p1 TRINITY_DN16449_c0_g3~~TRINITY_DN16449_c0_g3_i1.p1  ORF type:complete len:817 (-),score=226.63 TRINITY_DN16449_c0_g3_i1:147-2597(-)